MKPSITPKFNLSRIPTRIFLALILIWALFAGPLCVLTYSYLSRQLKREADARHRDQEQVLVQVFQQSARYGDIVDSKANIQSFGAGFGLDQVLVCRGGIEVEGALSPQICPSEGLKYAAEVSGQSLDLHFLWKEEWGDAKPVVLEAIAITLTTSLGFFLVIAYILYLYFVRKIGKLSEDIADADLLDSHLTLNYEIREFAPIVHSLKELQSKVSRANEQISNLRTAEAIGQLAKQVAHDIRSPLSALQICLQKLPSESDLSSLMGSAIKRINGIASDLLNREPEALGSRSLISPSLIRAFVQLKQTEFGSRANLILGEVMEITVPIPEEILFRMLSNMINNSVEAALEGRPVEIVISATCDKGTTTQIRIADNGKGIASEILSKLGASPVSEGKSGGDSGFGLGLSHVYQTIGATGGVVAVDSHVGRGTVITLSWN